MEEIIISTTIQTFNANNFQYVEGLRLTEIQNNKFESDKEKNEAILKFVKMDKDNDGILSS